jgi:hypothetical protein
MLSMAMLPELLINVSKFNVMLASCCNVVMIVFSFSPNPFKIGSKFGGILDMVTDRISTCGLLVVISGMYPDYSLYFILLIILDIASHWFHVMR